MIFFRSVKTYRKIFHNLYEISPIKYITKLTTIQQFDESFIFFYNQSLFKNKKNISINNNLNITKHELLYLKILTIKHSSIITFNFTIENNNTGLNFKIFQLIDYIEKNLIFSQMRIHLSHFNSSKILYLNTSIDMLHNLPSILQTNKISSILVYQITNQINFILITLNLFKIQTIIYSIKKIQILKTHSVLFCNQIPVQQYNTATSNPILNKSISKYKLNRSILSLFSNKNSVNNSIILQFLHLATLSLKFFFISTNEHKHFLTSSLLLKLPSISCIQQGKFLSKYLIRNAKIKKSKKNFIDNTFNKLTPLTFYKIHCFQNNPPKYILKSLLKSCNFIANITHITPQIIKTYISFHFTFKIIYFKSLFSKNTHLKTKKFHQLNVNISYISSNFFHRNLLAKSHICTLDIGCKTHYHKYKTLNSFIYISNYFIKISFISSTTILFTDQNFTKDLITLLPLSNYCFNILLIYSTLNQSILNKHHTYTHSVPHTINHILQLFHTNIKTDFAILSKIL